MSRNELVQVALNRVNSLRIIGYSWEGNTEVPNPTYTIEVPEGTKAVYLDGGYVRLERPGLDDVRVESICLWRALTSQEKGLWEEALNR